MSSGCQNSGAAELTEPQNRANQATADIIELIQNLGFALDEAVLAAMYLMPTQHAEPNEALQKLDRVKPRLMRALHLIHQVTAGSALKNG